jgi:hypothetical protein
VAGVGLAGEVLRIAANLSTILISFITKNRQEHLHVLTKSSIRKTKTLGKKVVPKKDSN